MRDEIVFPFCGKAERRLADLCVVTDGWTDCETFGLQRTELRARAAIRAHLLHDIADNTCFPSKSLAEMHPHAPIHMQDVTRLIVRSRVSGHGHIDESSRRVQTTCRIEIGDGELG